MERVPTPNAARDVERRRFLREAALMLTAAAWSLPRRADGTARQSRELAALRKARTWLTAPSPSEGELIGRVVLVQFCTFTCINWLRTLPYVRAWHERYTPGLTVIGVHTPEFGFERNVENVRRALGRQKVVHPVAIDNDQHIWHAFGNRYWPALYVLDSQGRRRHRHFGEGEYERSEQAIQALMAESVAGAYEPFVPVEGRGIELAADWTTLGSPEMYLRDDGSGASLWLRGAAPDRTQVDRTHASLALNRWSLSSEWTLTAASAALARAPGRIACRFHARDVHLVMGPPEGKAPVRFRVRVDGRPPGSAHGLDVDEDGNGSATDQRLYQLIRQSGPIVDRTFEIDVLDPGLEAFAFTFG